MARKAYVSLSVFALVVSLVVLMPATPAAAPDRSFTEALLKDVFEGRRVTVRIDMPGTKDGVNIHPHARRDLDVNRYRNDLRRHGVALRAGDTAIVTLVKVKDDLIEFQLDGGGFGTFFDDTSTSVHVSLIGKTEREKSLERRIRDEPDRTRRRQLERELSDLRRWREMENHRLLLESERLAAYKAERVAIQRMHGGSRFNIRFDRRVPYGFGPDDIMAALAEYVEFNDRSWDRRYRR